MTLSPELVSLIHHVELNQSGWWKKAVNQVLKGVMWTSQEPLPPENLCKLLNEIGTTLSPDVVSRQLEILVSQGAASVMPDGKYKLTEKERKSLSEAHDEAIREQELCKKSFLESSAKNCPDINSDEIWAKFLQSLLGAIRVSGANLFHLLADGNLKRETDWVERFISKFPSQHESELKAIVEEFFSPTNMVCRNQTLRLMTAHFFAEASQLRPETIALIDGNKKRTIRVVLDTNFVFSVLQLHDNPADSAALSLVELGKQLQNKLDIKLYVLPTTLDEAQRTIEYQMRLVERIRTTRVIANVALNQSLPSIAKKFFSAARQAPGLSAAEFFQPYINDLRTILQGKGIHVLDINRKVYSERQEIIDDVLCQKNQEDSQLAENKRKGYDSLMHDVTLWHAVRDRRSSNSETPFDVEYWAVSIDWRLIAFDKTKRQETHDKIPVVLHPTNLIQLIQFWVPRSKLLEESLIDAIRLPLYFQSFDPEDEKATLKVLGAISRYENVQDIPEPTLKTILANQALRDRLKRAEASNEEAFELVRDELLKEHNQTIAELHVTTSTLKGTSAKLEQSELELTQASTEIQRLQNELDKTKANADESARAKGEVELRFQKLQFFVIFWILPAFVGVLAWYLTKTQIAPLMESKQIESFNVLYGAWAFSLVPFAVACVLSGWYVKGHPAISGWGLAKFTAWMGAKVVLAPIMLAFGAIYQGGVWDWVKSFFGINF